MDGVPGEYVVRREVWAIQNVGRNLLERIPPKAVILACGPSTHAHMIEVRGRKRPRKVRAVATDRLEIKQKTYVEGSSEAIEAM